MRKQKLFLGLQSRLHRWRLLSSPLQDALHHPPSRMVVSPGTNAASNTGGKHSVPSRTNRDPDQMFTRLCL
ncbi:hypothetical protein EJ02DRAFT_18316 [Clathrospora elynae]|uniref:Uncharacterized protein n=1 Tax=Clathrospora elynae TaxID=706981 RepID=A0A6A5SN19_9PLEO|nr:hypothetical protein EJ02DRAFT_18316 [Clathrospora elynae]